jgi:dTDP-glucose pyrophosphorylase
MNIIIPMAGLGSRFLKEGITIPKPLIQTDGKTLIEHSVKTLGLIGQYIFITREYENKSDNETLSKILKQIQPNCIEIKIKEVTRGATETVLLAKDYINNNDELVITNCDQITNYDFEKFSSFLTQTTHDGVVVTYPSTNPKNSFALFEDNKIVKIVEKEALSNIALVGIHYWKKGNLFVESAEKLLKDFEIEGKKECYISETYNYLISKGYTIVNYHLKENQYIPLGTPYDIKIYEGKVKEFKTKKPQTIFCDIDGTLIKHAHRFSDLIDNKPILLDGVREKFNQWDSEGHTIIICTARKESAREMTETQLKSLGLCWDKLIMGCTNGDRVLINDKLNFGDKDRAKSVNVITNEGFETINWNDLEL